MIIWINGAFGAGKTQTAYELHRRIPNSFVFDPEEAGYYIRKNIPYESKIDDFQDYPMWRSINYSMISYIQRTYNGTLIIPMTLVNPQYFEEIVSRLREEGIEVHHFALMAKKEVILRRLRSRGDGRHSWPAQQIDRCVYGLENPLFEKHIDTNDKSITEVVEEIAAGLNLKLRPDRRGVMRKWFDRMMTKLKHIRLS